MGLINDMQPAAPVEGEQPTEQGNPVQALAAAAAKQVPPKYQDAFQRVVLAGRKFMYGDEKTHALLEKELSAAEDPVAAVGDGVTKLMGLLMKESRNTIPKEVFAPASLALMAEALDYVGQTRKRPISNEDITTATKGYADSMMQAAGITPQSFEQLTAKTQEFMQNPQFAQQIRQRAAGGQNGA